MNIFSKIIGYVVSIPARLKGMKFGRGSFIGPGYVVAPRLKEVRLGNNVVVGRGAWFDVSRHTNGGKIEIGDGTQIGRNVVISACKKISVGKKCLVSFNVTLADHDHEVFNPEVSPMDAGITEGKEIIIEDDCFIGAHSFILKGVRLGRHSVVGANSVVTKSFPDFSVIAGSPAKLIKNLKSVEIYGEKNEHLGFDAGA
jgi:acetyltransferase-like isoleucine patch superfamily enzyme